LICLQDFIFGSEFFFGKAIKAFSRNNATFESIFLYFGQKKERNPDIRESRVGVMVDFYI
jgi:hypothetical protein